MTDPVEEEGKIDPKSEKFAEVLRELFNSTGDRLKGIRLEKGMTQRDVRDKTSISDVYISGVEHGNRNPTLEKLCLLAYAYGYRIVILIEADKDIELVTKNVTELRQQELDEGKYIQVLMDMREEINAVLGNRDKEK